MLILWLLITFVLLLLYCAAAVRLLNSQLARRGINIYLITAGVLALIRIAALWFVNQRLQTHTYTSVTALLTYMLLPEGVVISELSLENVSWHMILFTTLLALGSFFWTYPLLLIGAKRKVASRS